MQSGVTLAADCETTFRRLQKKERNQEQYKYIIYKLSDDKKEIVVEKTSTSQDYEDFLKDLPERGCRWGVYDLEFEKDGGKRKAITLISWAPDIDEPDMAYTREKFTFPASTSVLANALSIKTKIQATSDDEVAYETVLKKAKQFSS
ncbi:hypothetical protein H0H92_009635 [Tricholoma furcatifolium]|nr:hypothetical protein H0H92_009635 [Tricholoma furcatifolium]